MRPSVRRLAVFVSLWTLPSLLVFAWLAGFFGSWDGKAASTETSIGELAVVPVRIVMEDRTETVQDWPARALQGLNLPVDRAGLRPVGDEAPSTTKAAFSLTFRVTPTDGGPVRVVSTLRPQPVGLGFLVFVLGIALRNMLVAGSPFALERPLPERENPKQKGGQALRFDPEKRKRSKKGPPPSRRGRGKR